MGEVGLFDSLRRLGKGGQKAGTLRKASSGDTKHLEEWAGSRQGVEAYVEPRTNVTDTTVVLIAHDGEWTRRRIDSLEAAQQFGHKRSIPVYEVARVGYPKRMREYTERKKRGQA
ncbi:oxidoreductase [Amycolatopsis sp. H20-H5]|uniref:oxidoreductase n=1 Tax=Amycolatopsis sp. H20-H5 TaxID=3046309 RepID=UPI002DBF22CA|nr:oxidoreductase [Amycolatopsis sp. H20-H5]MEC3982049.1 oxidoreductase [Amycolatopsis sp. H20-H5]